jgi:Flp pilus assembly protein TadD
VSNQNFRFAVPLRPKAYARSPIASGSDHHAWHRGTFWPFREAHNNLGNALRDKGDHDRAIVKYREAIRLKPDYAEAHNNLGLALGGMGELDGAIAEYREAIRLKPTFAEAHVNLGVTLGRDKGDLDGAVAELREAICLKPNLADAHLGLSVALQAKGERQAALDECREAFRLDPKNEIIRGNCERLAKGLEK